MNKLLLLLCVLSALSLLNSCSKDEDTVPKSDVQLSGHYATPRTLLQIVHPYALVF